MTNKSYIQDQEWFPSEGRERDQVQGQFERQLYRAIKVIRDLGKYPVIRCSEAVYTDYFLHEAVPIKGAVSSVYIFRGIPVSIRSDSSAPHAVEVLDHHAKTICTFQVRLKNEISS